MKTQEKVFREVRKVTHELIRCGLAVEYNFPIMQKNDIVWEKYRDISSHRLAFYPSPSFEIYQNDSDLYDADYIYGDVMNKNVLPVIIRADYSREKPDSEIHHPYSHMTLGGYKNCRIPVDRPIAPMQFAKFIMEHFYYVPSSRLEFNFDMQDTIKFEEHLSIRDQAKSRLVIG